MATRAIAEVYDEWDRLLVSIYKHWDGYPDGFGADLEAICEKYTIINGFGSETMKNHFANGMGCFAAQLIKELKDQIGDVYIHQPFDRASGAEYLYKITHEDGKVKVAWEEL